MSETLEDVESLQNMLVSRATGGFPNENEYHELREKLLSEQEIAGLLPRFIRTCRDLPQFWGYISKQSGSYQGRREHIWEAFRLLLERLEAGEAHPTDDSVASSLKELSAEAVDFQWRRALERRSTDPEGAITAARTLVETVCKHILDSLGIAYAPNVDLPALYNLTAENLQLAPSQYTEDVFKRVLGGCKTVVDGLASIRNRLGDSHGTGRKPVRPSPRHAELAVNLAGTMAAFLVSTWKDKAE